MVQKQWTLRALDQSKLRDLKSALGTTSEAVCSILVGRGLDTYEKAKEFVNPCLTRLHDPWLMKDMKKATERLHIAKERQEKILFFGDYDVDGTTAVAMMMRFFSGNYGSGLIDYYIPHRYREGYGLSNQGIDYAIRMQATLLITLDCGITAVDLIRRAARHGIDVIVCDHHLPSEAMPAAAAILNPKQAGCPYPFKELCGTGVAFKLLMALSQLWQLKPESYLNLLDLAALATGADVVPIRDQNRIFVHYGLERINGQPCAGIKALKNLTQRANKYTLNRVIFELAPKINAAGRMDHGKLAVQLLTTDDDQEAQRLASQLHEHNQDRKMQDKAVTTEAIKLLKERDPQMSARSLVVYGEKWHKGVLGIVASRLIEHFYRPAIVLTLDDGYISGSARSIAGFNIYDGIGACSEHLVRFGGHVAAAGITLHPGSLEAFTKKFEEVAAKKISDEQCVPKLYIDLEIRLQDIQWSFFNTLSRLEPFGHENEEPVFVTYEVTPHPSSRIVGETHVRFVFESAPNRYINGIAFGQKELFDRLVHGKPIDIVYSISQNEWNNSKSLQLNIIDFKPSS